MSMYWREPMARTSAATIEYQTNFAAKLFADACRALKVPGGEVAWTTIVEASPPDDMWHSLSNCVAYQAGTWQNMLTKDNIADVTHPAAFKIAIILRHIPLEIATKVLTDLLEPHPQAELLTNYVLTLLTDDNPSEQLEESVVPLRDRQLYGDCELAMLSAPRVEYDTHLELVRAEYRKLSHRSYLELRIKILNQLAAIPKLFLTPEFGQYESGARSNIEREISMLNELLLSAETS